MKPIYSMQIVFGIGIVADLLQRISPVPPTDYVFLAVVGVGFFVLTLLNFRVEIMGSFEK